MALISPDRNRVHTYQKRRNPTTSATDHTRRRDGCQPTRGAPISTTSTARPIAARATGVERPFDRDWRCSGVMGRAGLYPNEIQDIDSGATHGALREAGPT